MSKFDALERVRVAEEIAASFLDRCPLKKIDMVHERDEAPATVEPLNTKSMALLEQVSEPETVY